MAGGDAVAGLCSDARREGMGGWAEGMYERMARLSCRRWRKALWKDFSADCLRFVAAISRVACRARRADRVVAGFLCRVLCEVTWR